MYSILEVDRGLSVDNKTLFLDHACFRLGLTKRATLWTKSETRTKTFCFHSTPQCVQIQRKFMNIRRKE